MVKRGRKKAQFFIIGAVILGILILSSVSIWNVIIKSGKEATAQKQFNILCQNYKYEIFKMSEHAVKTGNKNSEPDLILEFTKDFVNYVKKSDSNFGIVYIYGNSTKVIIFNSTDYQIHVDLYEVAWNQVNGYMLGEISEEDIQLISISIGEKVNKEYEINKNKDFWFVGLMEKDGEEYVCE